MEPRELVRAWVEAFSRADVAALAALYSDDATNHQVAERPVVGRSAIREMFANEFARAKMVCIVENIFQDGEWAILEWRDPLGLRGCGFFHVVDDQIKFQRGYWDKLSFLRMHGLPIPESSTLRELEIALHQPEVRSDPGRLGALLHPEFREIGRSGAQYTRASVLEEFRASPQPYRVWSQDFRIERAGARYSSAYLSLGAHRRLWCSSGWRMRFHQGTPTE